MNKTPWLGILLGLCLLPAAGRAATANSTTPVTLTVSAACQVQSVSNIQFGNYDPVGIHAVQPSYASGTVSVVCSNGTSNVRVRLSQGSHPQGSSSCAQPLRQMQSAQGGLLSYAIYQDAGHQVPWGCDDASSLLLPAFDASLTPATVSTFGVLPPGQDAAVGQYQDTIEVSVLF